MQQKQNQNSVLICGLAGGTAGVLVDVVYYPFETIKTRIQASNNKVDYKQKAQNLDKYRGFSMQMLSSFPFAFLYFFSYEETKKWFNLQPQSEQSSMVIFRNFVAAAVAETVANTTRTPFEVVKQQQQVGHDKYVRDTIKVIYQNKGLRGFYAGFGPLLFRDIPFSAIQLPLYEFLKKGKQRDLTVFESIYSGAIAGAVSAFLTTPMDVVKSKVMTQRDNYYKSSLDCVGKVFKEEGFQAFFKGCTYRTFPMAFTGTIFFTVYEQAKNFYYNLSEKY